MWRMRRGERLSAHAIIGVQGRRAWVMWFLNGRPIGSREFEDWESALLWTDRMREQNWSVGWRLLPDDDDVPPTPEVEC